MATKQQLHKNQVLQYQLYSNKLQGFKVRGGLTIGDNGISVLVKSGVPVVHPVQALQAVVTTGRLVLHRHYGEVRHVGISCSRLAS